MAKFFQKIFRDLLTAQYIHRTPLKRSTFPLLWLWNLVFDFSFGTLYRLRT